MSLDLKPALRSALLDVPAIVALLAQWKGEGAVFTRRPVPDDAPLPLAVISKPTALNDEDGLSSDRPVATHQIAFYGRKGRPGSTEDHTREVEEAAFLARQHFHRNRFSVVPTGYSVIDVQVRGPVDAPVDDDNMVGAVVVLTVRLRRQT